MNEALDVVIFTSKFLENSVEQILNPKNLRHQNQN